MWILFFREPRGVKLVIDVIKYELPAVKRALQFTCGNSLVCESADDARKVAFGQVQARRKVLFCIIFNIFIVFISN